MTRARERQERADASAARTFLVDVGGVIAAWIVLLAVENLVVGIGWRADFVASWEMGHARAYASPIALAVSPPLAVVAVAIARLLAARNVRGVAALAFAAAALAATFVSTGRHFASLAVRGPFVLVVGIAAAAIAAAIARRAPLDRPRTLAAAGVILSVAAWTADAFVYPRLYPAFHMAMLAVVLGGWALLFLAIRGWSRASWVAGAAGIAALASAGWAPSAARKLVGDDNLRRVLVEHAPILGPAVLAAARIAPPPPLDDDANEAALTAALVASARPGAARDLDWTGRDVVVVTVDALRADHVSSYGYPRATTPNIDRLATRGTRFAHAYCPTPHTSYSVASMMTGKYMRPLLAIGAPGAAESETWADYLRRYGFRTAAFYPPAVFFIDEHRFEAMRDRSLGFEYKKEEYAAPALRRKQIAEYVAAAPKDKPLFLWVHLFEPHEPYVVHSDHVFPGDSSVDAYDSEVALADAIIGDVVKVVDDRRPGAVFVVSADHGEEFGDHGGRYHGTTVYEEQVRVPLVVVGPGVAARVVDTPVQTIDLLPTTLAALDVPRPARLRGRDLGGILAGSAPPSQPGLAFAETDDYTMVASGADRLVCLRKIGSCTLFDVSVDPKEDAPRVGRDARVDELRRLTAAVERENGRVEASTVPEALRRGLQGDRDSAEDVTPLLDDARVDIRREAARCLFGLHAEATKTQLRRASSKDEDALVKSWATLALVRMNEEPTASPLVEAALRGDDARLRVATALALAERSDARGEGELVRHLEGALAKGTSSIELDEGRDLLHALGTIKAKSATPALVRLLADVRLRLWVVAAMEQIGDPKAKDALLSVFVEERYVNLRPHEARVLVQLGAKEEMRAPLARFAGVPEPTIEGMWFASQLGFLVPERGGFARKSDGPEHLDVTLRVEGKGPARLLLFGGPPGSRLPPTGTVDGVPIAPTFAAPAWVAELGERPAGPWNAKVVVDLAGGISYAWIVRRAEEIPPPPPK